MSEPTQLERLTAARKRIAKAMRFKCLTSGGYSELLTDDGAELLVGVDQAEAIAGRLEELANYKRGFPTCDNHRPTGGFRTTCLVCALIELEHALSRISGILQPGCDATQYDFDRDVESLVKAIAERLERKKVRVEAAPWYYSWLPALVLVADDEEVNIIYEPCGSKVAVIEEARRVAEQLGLEVVE